MKRKQTKPLPRFLVLMILCSAAGVGIGGFERWLTANQCLQARVVTSECLAKTPGVSLLEGMVLGWFAGVGAALGIGCQNQEKKELT